MQVRHTDRIRKRHDIIAFATGATVCIGATFLGTIAFIVNHARSL